MQIKILTIYTRSQVYLWPDCIFLNMYSFQIFNECQFYCKRVLWHKKASGLIRALCTFIYLTKLYEMYFCHILNWMEIINRRPVSFTVSTFSNWNSSIRNVCPFSPVYSITIINMDSWVLSLIWGVIICYCHNLFEHVLLKCPDSLFCLALTYFLALQDSLDSFLCISCSNPRISYSSKEHGSFHCGMASENQDRGFLSLLECHCFQEHHSCNLRRQDNTDKCSQIFNIPRKYCNNFNICPQVFDTPSLKRWSLITTTLLSMGWIQLLPSSDQSI